jgi:hypothetical protein
MAVLTSVAQNTHEELTASASADCALEAEQSAHEHCKPLPVCSVLISEDEWVRLVDDLLQDSVAQKRRSCSGSRNGTPAVRDRRSTSVDPEAAAMMAEDFALEASLAAAEAAAVHIEKQVVSWQIMNTAY